MKQSIEEDMNGGLFYKYVRYGILRHARSWEISDWLIGVGFIGLWLTLILAQFL